MPGIYIHIPFCRLACHYCDFHFSTSLKNKAPFLSSLKKEIIHRKDYLNNEAPSDSASLPDPPARYQSVYFGGGTPSLLSQKEILDILNELGKNYSIDKNPEITLEANPDDLTWEKISALKNTPVNRLSIGIQSFSDTDLQLLNRTHTSGEAIKSVDVAQDSGFENISIDLIYGIPTLSNEQWKKNLEIAFKLGVPHISAYCLTVEPKTALSNFILKGKIKNMDDEKATQQFEILMDKMEKNGFVHYEISNFCKSNSAPFLGAREKTRASIHNSSYWKGEHYIGFGPSAHSYNGESRQWNVGNNNLYIRSLEKDQLDFEKEILTENDKYNEYILTSLRTIWGCDLSMVKKKSGEKFLSHLLKNADPYILGNRIQINENVLSLTKKGKFIADKIVSDLFV